MAGRVERVVDGLGQLPILVGVRRVVVVEADREIGEVALVFLADAPNELFRLDAFGAGLEHDRRAVGVVRTDINTAVAAQLLETHPDVGLDVFHQMAEMIDPLA